MLPDNLLEGLHGLRFIGVECGGCADQTGTDGVDSDAAGAVVDCVGAGELEDGAFGGTVGCWGEKLAGAWKCRCVYVWMDRKKARRFRLGELR